MKETITVPAMVERITMRKDKSVKIEFETQEMSPEEAALLFGMTNTIGYLAYKATPITKEEVVELPDETPEFKDDKTPSQRLRAVLYVYWKEKTEHKVPFTQFYAGIIERMIEAYKEKLPNNEE